MSFKSSRPIAKLIPPTIVSVIKSQKKDTPQVFVIFMQRRLFWAVVEKRVISSDFIPQTIKLGLVKVLLLKGNLDFLQYE